MKRKSIFTFLVITFCVVNVFATIDLVKYDASKGEYRRREDQRTYIVGKIINIAYELQHRPEGADAQDALFSKGRQGLKTSGDVVWTFVDNIKGQELQWNKDHLGKYIKIYGWVFHDAHYIEVDSYALDNVKYVWNDTTNTFEASFESEADAA
ncbi:MAG: hypothetical protein JW938_02070 [Candidatus Omnitrophica bacterium]|nr:hypothetical protein [Candidatus Omnitrophota bacterium]